MKIHIVGCPGSGKSFLAEKLSTQYGIPHYDLDELQWDKNIACPTVFLKAKTEFSRDGIQNCALTDDDVDRIGSLVPDFSVIRFDCGHGIHIEKKREFLKVFE